MPGLDSAVLILLEGLQGVCPHHIVVSLIQRSSCRFHGRRVKGAFQAAVGLRGPLALLASLPQEDAGSPVLLVQSLSRVPLFPTTWTAAL